MATYELALSSLIYFNEAPEPTLDPARVVEFQVFDGRSQSNLLVGFVDITLVDDNNLTLSCGAGLFSFTEGSATPISLAESLSLSDLDADHAVSSASVVITNPQPGDEVAVGTSISSFIQVQHSENQTRVDLTGRAMATQYQVRGSHSLVCYEVKLLSSLLGCSS